MTREYTPVNHAPRVCDYCGETYKPRQKNSVRCPSDDCRKAHNRKKMRECTKRWSEELGHSYIARIAELERALSAVAPGHEALNRVPTN